MKYDINTLTLEEKLTLLTGVDSWRLSNANGKLPQIFLADGPHGLRKIAEDGSTIKATAMPALSVLANTWNEELSYLQGNTIADECLINDVDVLLAPGVNIKRTPLCGRNFEYFSEDPFLTGKLAKSYIEGVQQKGVGTSLKHFYANNAEYDRLHQSSELDERTAREIYLPAFEEAVKAKPWTVMCSYNLINGIYSAENKYALNDILRKAFGFEGMIISDWEAVRDSAKSAKATLDLRMPYYKDAFNQLKTAYDEGWLNIEEINACVLNILNFIEKTVCLKGKVTTDKNTRHGNAKKIASEGMVLLKNEGILPLNCKTVTVVGAHETEIACGGGSSKVESDYTKESITDLLNKTGVVKATRPNGWISNGTINKRLGNIIRTAYSTDVAVLVVGTNRYNEFEGADRDSLKLSIAQEKLILGVAEVNPNVVVVIEAGSAIDMSAWIDKVKAVLFAGFAGEGANEVITDILIGKTNPSGKLTETFPIKLEDTPTYLSTFTPFVNRYTEGVFVGYRYYDSYKKEVLYPFGHGLSYSKFEYLNMKIEKKGETDYVVKFDVKNVSNVDGAEVCQLYVKDVFAMVSRPEKELKGFKKVYLKAGEKTTVEIPLDFRSFAYYSVPLKKWIVENGTFEILVGASSRNILLKDKIEINLPYKDQISQN